MQKLSNLLANLFDFQMWGTFFSMRKRERNITDQIIFQDLAKSHWIVELEHFISTSVNQRIMMLDKTALLIGFNEFVLFHYTIYESEFSRGLWHIIYMKLNPVFSLENTHEKIRLQVFLFALIVNFRPLCVTSINSGWSLYLIQHWITPKNE